MLTPEESHFQVNFTADSKSAGQRTTLIAPKCVPAPARKNFALINAMHIKIPQIPTRFSRLGKIFNPRQPQLSLLREKNTQR
jgi:hypothetical protein